MTINEKFITIVDELFAGNKARFARTIGVNPTVIQNIIGTRKGNPSFEILVKVCANTNINPAWLLTDSNDAMVLSEEFKLDTSNKEENKDTLLEINGRQSLRIEALNQEIGALKAKNKLLKKEIGELKSICPKKEETELNVDARIA